VLAGALVVTAAAPPDDRRAIFDAQADTMVPMVAIAGGIVHCGLRTREWERNEQTAIEMRIVLIARRLWPGVSDPDERSVQKDATLSIVVRPEWRLMADDDEHYVYTIRVDGIRAAAPR
jgi:hypothetical protein